VSRAAGAMQAHSDAHGMLDEGVLASVVGYHIVLAAITTRRLYMRAVGEPLKLKPVEYSILMLLLANDDVTPKQLCRTINVSAPNLTLLLDGLQQRELLTRVRSETDRRSQLIHLTRKGEQVARKARDLTAAMESDLHHLSSAERAMLIELLQKVARQRRE
jgi:DNA-binding MarR family transcriptional regulator